MGMLFRLSPGDMCASQIADETTKKEGGTLLQQQQTPFST